MATIISKEEILSIVDSVDVVAAMEEGFIKYSKGETIVPPIGELIFDSPPGDTHIKYGYIKGDKYFCIKIASGFYDNPQLGISSSQGMILLFKQATGEPAVVLLDGGALTNIRTAAAGALAAKYFAPSSVHCTGIVGTGIQGKLQLEMLDGIISCRKVLIWDRDPESASLMKQRYSGKYDMEITKNPSELAKRSKLIICATPSESALITEKDINPGTHITAVGSDTPAKQELSAGLVSMADILISDSIEQSHSRGEIFRARQEGKIDEKRIVELGTALQNRKLQRLNDKQISIVDLTGVAVQDIMIATAVYNKYLTKN